MDISMGICYLRKQRGTTEMRSMRDCARITRDAGFRYVDFNGTYFIKDDNWRQLAEEVLDDFDRFGLIVDQTHAIYVYNGIAEADYREYMKRSFELAHMAGAANIVFDCAELDFIDSTTLGTFVKILKRVKTDGFKMSLINLKPKIKKLFLICSLNSIMEIA